MECVPGLPQSSLPVSDRFNSGQEADNSTMMVAMMMVYWILKSVQLTFLLAHGYSVDTCIGYNSLPSVMPPLDWKAFAKVRCCSITSNIITTNTCYDFMVSTIMEPVEEIVLGALMNQLWNWARMILN